MIYVDKIFISVLYFHVYKNADFSAYCQFTQARLYYFPNGLKQALFWPYLQVQFQKKQAFSHASTKNFFKNVFTEDGFDAIIVFHEDQITSLLDLQFIILNGYIISAESYRIHYGLN